MLQVLASFLIFLNPVIGFFTPSQSSIQDAPEKEVIFSNSVNLDDYKLPISESIFLASQFIPTYPIRNWDIPDPNITAKIALVFESTRQKILWQKNGLHESQPIASLTKLMTAIVVMENAAPEDVLTVSKNAVAQNGEMGGLIVGEQLTVKNLLYALLIESSNDAAIALAEGVGNKIIFDSSRHDRTRSNNNRDSFIDLMNQKVRSLGLSDTNFTEPSGLDPGNRSSAWDLNIIMQKILMYPVLQDIMQTPAIDFQSVDGKFKHHLRNTDKLLDQFPEIIAGKTGYTEEAGNCLILAWRAPLGESPLTGRAPNDQGTIISIIMDSQDRMAESAALLQWTKNAFLW